MQTPTYKTASKELLDQAAQELADGDVRQASEKGWGAAAQMVKAVAQQRGWRHDGHAYLYRAVATLADETGDTDLHNLFHVASSLHINFYENWLPGSMVQSGLSDVQRFLDKLDPLAASLGHSAWYRILNCWRSTAAMTSSLPACNWLTRPTVNLAK